MEISELEKFAKEVRRDIIKMLTEAGSGHPGGSLSSVEIMVALYFKFMRHKPKEPRWPDRDRFILSKGHVCPTQYACLARSGYFPVSELETLRKCGSRLQGHPGKDKNLQGIEISSGSLGQNLSVACGVALAGKMDKRDYRVYCLMGDGEIQEGQIWEAAMTASQYGLDNLCGILDNNDFQIDGSIKDVKNIYPLEDKWKSFGWNVFDVDGHNLSQLLKAFSEAESVKGKPSIIIARTIKGKGVSFMEGNNDWHGKAPSKEQAEQALKELE